MEFKNYKVRYRPGLDLVLKSLTFTINSGEKVIKNDEIYLVRFLEHRMFVLWQ